MTMYNTVPAAEDTHLQESAPKSSYAPTDPRGRASTKKARQQNGFYKDAIAHPSPKKQEPST